MRRELKFQGNKKIVVEGNLNVVFEINGKKPAKERILTRYEKKTNLK